MIDAITQASQTATATKSDSASATGQGLGLDKDAFLKLLVAQMRYQNPMNPSDGQQYLAQAAQFATVERLQDIAKSQSEAIAYQQILLSSNMVGRQITANTEERLSRAQREMLLREQLKSIQAELGEGDGNGIADLRRQIEEAGLPDEARTEAERELGRLESIPEISPEHGMIRTYLDWMVSLPWAKLSGGDIDVAMARDVLDRDHYDLDKVKERILEHL